MSFQDGTPSCFENDDGESVIAVQWAGDNRDAIERMAINDGRMKSLKIPGVGTIEITGVLLRHPDQTLEIMDHDDFVAKYPNEKPHLMA